MGIKQTNPTVEHATQPQPQNPNLQGASPNPNTGGKTSYGGWNHSVRAFSTVPWSLTDTSQLFGGGVAIYSEVAAALEKAMRESRISTSNYQYECLPLTRAEYPQLGVDVILLLVSMTSPQFKGVTSVYAIGLAPNNEPVNAYQVQMPDGSRLITNEFPSQTLGGEVPKFLVDVARTHVTNGDYVVFSGSTVICTDAVDVSSEEVARNAIINGITAGRLAILRRVSASTGVQIDINLDEFCKDVKTGERTNLHLALSRRISDEPVRDLTNSPVRADMVFNLVTVPQSDNGNNRLAPRTDFGMSTAYIDVLPTALPGQTVSTTGIWNDVPQQSGNGAQRMYTANVVFTGLFHRGNIIIPTLGSQLFLLASSVSALDGGDDWWARFGLNPNTYPGQHNRHSIDGLGYEVSSRLALPNFEPLNGSEPINDDQYLHLIGKYFHPEYGISLEVNESTEGYYTHNQFARASSESADKANESNSANCELLDAADNLTNGRFRHHYVAMGGTGKVVSELQNRVTIYGHYTDPKTGQVRSLQDFDRRMLLNMVDGRPEVMEVVRQWTYAQVDPALTYDQRKVIMCECIGRMVPNAVITGYGRRLDFEPAFIKALVKAIYESGARLHMNNVQSVPGGHHVATYMANHVMGSMGIGLVQNTPYVTGGSGAAYGAYGAYGQGW